MTQVWKSDEFYLNQVSRSWTFCFQELWRPQGLTRNVATFNITSVVQIFIRFKRAVAAEQPGDGGELAGAALLILEDMGSN